MKPSFSNIYNRLHVSVMLSHPQVLYSSMRDYAIVYIILLNVEVSIFAIFVIFIIIIIVVVVVVHIDAVRFVGDIMIY